MGRVPTLLVLLLNAASSSAGPCKYYVSHPTRLCVNDGQQGPGQILLSATKEECCNTLPRKQRRECLATEVPSEVYPDFEQGRCSSATVRPAVVHPTCGVTDSGATKSIVPLFLRESLPVADNELCCMRVYGGIGQAAIDRCVARTDRWYYVEGMGCVGGDPLDNPVVYSTAQTASNLSTCTATYFPLTPSFMCATFPCPGSWTSKPDGIHCGSEASDCTKELCCAPLRAPCSNDACDAAVKLTPPGTLTYPEDFPASGWTLGYDEAVNEAWRIDCDHGVVQIDISILETETDYDHVTGSIIRPDGTTTTKSHVSGSYAGHVGRIDYTLDRVAPYTLGTRGLLQYTADSVDASAGFVVHYCCV